MKKLFIIFALAFACASASAQEMTSKKGFLILPETGDWSIGFDAVPVLEYFGNLANGKEHNTISANWTDGVHTITGKIIRPNDIAWRGSLRIGFGSFSFNQLVPNAATPALLVNDETKISYDTIALSFGIQKYRGNGRVRGYYGAELGVLLTGLDTTFTYGNSISSYNTSIVRVTEDKAGSGFGIGLRGFIGVEYFFAPKMSIGAEYGWGFALVSIGEGKQTTHSWDGTTETTTTSKSGSASA
ncbi:MAG: hypothetical protein JJE25_08360, partial [Bacteroidia bacterium]|nr:hypothetical protein [Bacteroidia bacterium]